MTTIAYKDGVMAADSRAYSGDSTPIGHKTKIHRLEDGSLIGVSSCKPGVPETFIKWVREGANIDKTPNMVMDFLALHVKPTITGDAEITFYNSCFVAAGPVFGPYFSIGSGEKYALGAFSMGADAVQAIQAACMHDAWSKEPITRLELYPAVRTAEMETVVEEVANVPFPPS